MPRDFAPPVVRARRPEHKQQRREAILEAARDLALRRGVRTITLGDLADAVGLAKSNVVRYFGTREEIFVELCSDEGLVLRDVLLPRLADVTEETLPAVLAGTLMEHELFCELVSQLTTNLEHNVSYAAAERLKVLYGATLASPSDDRETISVPRVGDDERENTHQVARSKLVRIIRPRIGRASAMTGPSRSMRRSASRPRSEIARLIDRPRSGVLARGSGRRS